MKRLLLCSFLLTLWSSYLWSVGENVVLPYSIDFTQGSGYSYYGTPNNINSASTFEKWTIINAGYGFTVDKGGAWQSVIPNVSWIDLSNGFKEVKCGYAAECQYKKVNADAWIVTPGIPLETGKSYTIAYAYKSVLSTTDKFQVTIGKAPEAENMERIIDTKEFENTGDYEYLSATNTITVNATGTYYIGIHCISEHPTTDANNSNHFCIGGFAVAEGGIVTPLAATELTVTPGENQNLSALLNWNNPSQGVNGETLTGNLKACIYRNNVLVHTLTDLIPGSAEEWEDTTIPESGKYTYKIQMKYDVVYGETIVSSECEIGNVYKGVLLPYSIDLTKASYGKPDDKNPDFTYKEWIQINPNGQYGYTKGGAWGSYIEDHNGYAASCFHKTANADAWLVTPEILLEGGKKYTITYTYRRNVKKDETEKFEVAYGNDKTAEALKNNVLGTPHIVTNDEYMTGVKILTIENTGRYYIGFHCISEGTGDTSNRVLCLGEFFIEEGAEVKPMPITNLTVTPDPNKKLSARLSWTNPTQGTREEDLIEPMTVEIYRNGIIAGTIENIQPGSTTDWEDTKVPQAGKYTYSIQIGLNGIFSEQTESAEHEIGDVYHGIVIPYTIDLTQEQWTGKPDDNNAIQTWMDAWTKINGTTASAGGTWCDRTDELTYYSTSGRISAGICAYNTHNSVTADAWAITPEILLEGGKAYTISYKYKRFGSVQNTEKFEIGIGTDPTAETLKARIVDTKEVTNDEYETGSVNIPVETTEKYYIGIHCISAPAADDAITYLCLGEFSIKEALVPSPITNLTVTPDPDKKLSAKLTWINPATGTRQEPLTEKMNAEIYRNEELIHTLTDIEPDSNTEWTDETLTVAGTYVYSIKLELNGVYSSLVKSAEYEIGEVYHGVILPYNIDFTQNKYYGETDEVNKKHTWYKGTWTKINPNGEYGYSNGGAWGAYTMEDTYKDSNGETVSSGLGAYCLHKKENANAWAITPGLPFEEGKTYAVTYSYKRFSKKEMAEKFDVTLGTAPTEEAQMQNIIKSYEITNDEYVTETIKVKAPSTETYYIGLHCISKGTGDANDNYFLYIGSFAIEKIPAIIPNSITELTVLADPEKELTANLSWTNPTEGTKGETLEGTLTVEIYRGDELLETLTEVQPGNQSTFIDEVEEAGTYIYSVRVASDGTFSEKTSAPACELKTRPIPAKVTEFTAVQKDEVTLAANLSWINPAKDTKERELEGKLTVEICRDNEPIKTLTDIQSGSQSIYTDEVGKAGVYVYSVRVSLNGIYSETAIAPECAIIKPKPVPAPVENLTAIQKDEQTLVAILSWKNPTKDTVGNDIEGTLNYEIFRDNEFIGKATDIQPGEQTTYTDEVKEAGVYVYSVHVSLNGIYSEDKTVECKINPSSIENISATEMFYDKATGNLYIGNETNITIYNSTGVCMAKEENVFEKINLNSLPAGTYIIQASGNKRIKIVK